MNLTTNATINLRLSFDDRGDIAVSTVITNTNKMRHEDYYNAVILEFQQEDFGGSLGVCFSAEVTIDGKVADKIIILEAPHEEVYFLTSNREFKWGSKEHNEILIMKHHEIVEDDVDGLPF